MSETHEHIEAILDEIETMLIAKNKQYGNSVSVPVVEAIADRIFKVFPELGKD